jgi:hypothetical protein
VIGLALKQEDVKKLVLSEMRKIDDTELFFELQKRGIQYLKDLTVVKCCLALSRLGLPITVYIVSYVTGQPMNTVRSKLHILGDKHLLTLKRPTGVLEWTLGPLLKQLQDLNKRSNPNKTDVAGGETSA